MVLREHKELGARRLSRQEKQVVRRYIRQLAARHGRGHRGDRGTVAGTRGLIRRANERMGAEGSLAVVMYPQDVGAGWTSVRQILARGRPTYGRSNGE
jgi:hypothetical protein